MAYEDEGLPVDGRNYTYPDGHQKIDTDKHRPIDETSAELCVFYLEETAEAHAAWTARRKFLEKHISVIEAIETSNVQAGTVTDKRRVAKTSRKYQNTLRELEEAIYHETLLTAMRDAAEMKFKGWQSKNANYRKGLGQQ